MANKGQSIQQKNKNNAQQHNNPADIHEPTQEVVSTSHFSGSEEYLQKIINIASDMKIDAQLSLEIMNDFRRLYRELSIFGNDLNESQQISAFDKDTEDSFDEDAFSEKTELQKSFRQTMQHCNELFEKLDLSHVEHKNKVNQLSKSALNCRMGPFANCLTGLTRLVRDLSKKQHKSVNLNILGEKTPIDRDILEELSPVLIHLVQNSIDHGVAMPVQRLKQDKKEQATLTISAQDRSGYLIINVKDDGNGIDLDNIRKKIVERNMVAKETANKLSDEELLSFIFLPQFTLKKKSPKFQDVVSV
ncbi:hypothetical protein ACLKMH_18640 [Psychromonas sp. KJ10-10]|uniref:hypothetical protein n=1 Tax=Psychromonas sp. KJ10-10 TaxID=3391823 RepID=UPI0039B69AD2